VVVWKLARIKRSFGGRGITIPLQGSERGINSKRKEPHQTLGIRKYRAWFLFYDQDTAGT